MHDKEIKNDKVKGIVILIVGFLQAVMGFLAALNIEFQWLTDASINAFGLMIAAGVMLGVGLYAVWKNTFTGKKAQIQNEELHKRNLK
ncbi:phage holin [Oceanobacillus oncorhynchi]|uniref:phage holin n=1 Tax=Oceanobacillus oncorhynchi TaxID=545501 RepID=UPI0025A32ADA|nr:phage holin [Oceanobacillus oncorhynchi]MDM8098650.1 phage holin [Oceanobacillus oncorhynchi]